MAAAELQAAKSLAKRVGVLEHRIVRIPDLREAGDISGSRDLSRGRVPSTYIPMKNAIYYSVGAAFAEEKGAGAIIGGHNRDDREVFEDTGDEFFAYLEKAFLAGSKRLKRNDLRIQRPLKDKSKAEVVALAAGVGVPLELTWSCHRAGAVHCWKCEGCGRRIEAFDAAGVRDPLRVKKV